MSKRDREVNIQAWFDPEDPSEKSVIQAFEHLRDKFGMTTKKALAEAILFAAQSEGFTASAAGPVHANGDLERMMEMMSRLMGMIEGGSFVAANEAARQSFDEDTVQFDAISASVGNRYRKLDFEDED